MRAKTARFEFYYYQTNQNRNGFSSTHLGAAASLTPNPALCGNSSMVSFVLSASSPSAPGSKLIVAGVLCCSTSPDEKKNK
jgi:hypothetical protein